MFGPENQQRGNRGKSCPKLKMPPMLLVFCSPLQPGRMRCMPSTTTSRHAQRHSQRLGKFLIIYPDLSRSSESWAWGQVTLQRASNPGLGWHFGCQTCRCKEALTWEDLGAGSAWPHSCFSHCFQAARLFLSLAECHGKTPFLSVTRTIQARGCAVRIRVQSGCS